jgi:hypothetical protein
MIRKTFILALWICASSHVSVAKDFFLVKYAKGMKDRVFILKAQKGVPLHAGPGLRSGSPGFDYYLTKSDLTRQPDREGQFSLSGNRYDLRDSKYAEEQDMLEVKFSSRKETEIRLHFPNASGLSKADFANLMSRIFSTDPEEDKNSLVMDNFKELLDNYFERRRRTCPNLP